MYLSEYVEKAHECAEVGSFSEAQFWMLKAMSEQLYFIDEKLHELRLSVEYTPPK